MPKRWVKRRQTIKGGNEASGIKKSHYDENDMDINKLKKFVEKHEVLPMNIEEYIKNANEDDEELYKDFGKTEASAELGRVRSVCSAHMQKANNMHKKAPLSATQRMPLEIVKEKQSSQKLHIKKINSKNLKRIRPGKGGGFSITSDKVSTKRSIKSSLLSTPKFPYTSFINKEGNLNFIRRPTTAAIITKERVKSEERPISACVIIGDNVNKYVPTIYPKPFAGRQRPISAAVSNRVPLEKDCLGRIDPAKAKTKYLKCLKELEAEAKQFVLEEDYCLGINESKERQSKYRCINKERTSSFKISI